MIIRNETTGEAEGIIISGARCSYPHLMKPTKPRGKENDLSVVAKYQITGILCESDPQWGEFQIYYTEVARKEWGDAADAMLQALAKNQRCWGWGREVIDMKATPPGVRKGYRDEDTTPAVGSKVYVHGKNEERPVIIDPKTGAQIDATKQMAYQAAAQLIKPGCLVDLQLRLWAYSNENKGISSTIVAVRFAGAGEPLGGGAPRVMLGQPVPGAPAPTGVPLGGESDDFD